MEDLQSTALATWLRGHIPEMPGQQVGKSISPTRRTQRHLAIPNRQLRKNRGCGQEATFITPPHRSPGHLRVPLARSNRCQRQSTTVFVQRLAQTGVFLKTVRTYPASFLGNPRIPLFLVPLNIRCTSWSNGQLRSSALMPPYSRLTLEGDVTEGTAGPAEGVHDGTDGLDRALE